MFIRNLSVLAYANGFTLWHYRAKDTGASDVLSCDFFLDAHDMLAPGDMMMVSGDNINGIFSVQFEPEPTTGPHRQRPRLVSMN